jgi:hypothetical protein
LHPLKIRAFSRRTRKPTVAYFYCLGSLDRT